MAALPTVTFDVNYEEDKKEIKQFFYQFTSSSKDELEWDMADMGLDDDDVDVDQDMGEDGERPNMRGKYMRQLQAIANRSLSTLTISLEDIYEHQQSITGLVNSIIRNTQRYTTLFSEVVDEIMPPATKPLEMEDDALDVILHQRREMNAGNEQEDLAGFPPQLLRRYTLYFQPLASSEALSVRSIRASLLGRLITLRGIITRVSEVKPLLLVNAYTCDTCGSEIFQDITNKQFTPLVDCPSAGCEIDRVRGTLHMQTRACRFSAFQEVRIQEMADQVPVGHIPRSMTIHLSGSLTRSMHPGDVVDVSGIFLPTPYTGFQAIRAGLLTDTYLEAHSVVQLKAAYSDMAMTPDIVASIAELREDPDLYPKLAASIAPEIYGHEDVKKVLLLLLVGGVSKVVGDGMKIRGDINVCLMGDPGTAKSQLLKYISKVAPRGVYTTGKGSSGVGLTAAVMRDPGTDEMVLEGGALVLADNGICCIDEFDKMEESDRTAIHEVMEQQTISISKAGISTTLNARTSILAAANPLYGRYNPKVSPVENINLPAALLSRFDVMWLILDRPDREGDERLGKHVTWVHMYNEHPPLEYEPIDPKVMRAYISRARQCRPTVPASVSSYVVEAYVRLRASSNSTSNSASSKSHSYTSARTLLAVLRLSQALARLRFADTVISEDVDEALRLMEMSKASLEEDDDEREGGREGDQSTATKIFRIIKDMAARRGRGGPKRTTKRPRRLGRGPGGENAMDVDSNDEEDEDEDGDDYEELTLVDVRQRIQAAGFTEIQMMDTIAEYEELDILTRTANGSKIRFVQ